MSALHIHLSSLPSSCQKFSQRRPSWWKFDKVMTKIILHNFIRHHVYTRTSQSENRQFHATSDCSQTDIGLHLQRHVPAQYIGLLYSGQ